jgi:Ulp1 family protease
MITRGWITLSETEAFYRRTEYLLTKGTSLMQMENVAKRNEDCLEKLQERRALGNLSTDLKNLEVSMGAEVMKNFYSFRSFVVNLLSSDEHVRKISYLNSMFECLIITKKVQGQFQSAAGEQKKENKAIVKTSIFHLSECMELIERKKFESLDLALNKAKLCVQAKDVRHSSYQSLSDQEQMEARRSCELGNETLSNLTFSALWMHRCWPQMKQYFVGSNHIKHNKLLDLREGNMIGNEVVDAYFALLSYQCKSSDFFIGDLHQLSKNYSACDVELQATFNILMKKKQLLFPYHVDGIHFQLVLITVKDYWSFSLDIFDSIRVQQMAHKERYYAPVLELISKIMLAGGINDYEVEEKSFPFLNEQKNGCDCGIFMCMIAASLTGMIDEH